MALDQNIIQRAGIASGMPNLPTGLQKQMDSALDRQTDIGNQMVDVGKQEEALAAEKGKAMAPIRDKIAERAKDMPPSTVKEEAPKNYERPTMKPEELHEAFGAMMVASMLVGAASRTPYNNVMTAMTGAMDGFMKKDEQIVKDSMQEFDRNLKVIKERNDQKRRELDDAWSKYKNDLGGLKLEMEMIAARYDDPQLALAARSKSLTQMQKLADSNVKAADTAIERFTRIQEHAQDMQQRYQMHRETMGANNGGGGQLTPGDVAAAATGMPLNQIVQGYRGSAVAQRNALRQAAIQKIAQDSGMTNEQAGQEWARRTVEFTAGKASVGQLTKMEGATKQAIDQLDFNIDKATEEMKKLPSSDLSPVLNAIARGTEKWTGQPEYSSLFYYLNGAAIEAARIRSGGQASIAQLHQGAAEEASQWANVNMTPSSWDAVANAMKQEGRAKLKTYKDAVTYMQGSRVSGGGNASWSDADEARLKELEAKHAGQ